MQFFGSKQELIWKMIHIFDRNKPSALAGEESRSELLVNPSMNLCIVELIGQKDWELHGRIDADSKIRTRYFKSAQEMTEILEAVVEEKYKEKKA